MMKVTYDFNQWIKYFLYSILLSSIALACGPPSSSNSKKKGEVTLRISGVVATGLAVGNVPVTIQDQTGKTVSPENCRTDAKGKFSCSVEKTAATDTMFLTSANMTSLIVGKPITSMTRNINPITDFITDQATGGSVLDTTDRPLTVTVEEYEAQVMKVSLYLGVKSEKFISESFQPKLSGVPTSGSAIDDVLEALKKDGVLNKQVIQTLLNQATVNNPVVADPKIQVRLATAALKREEVPDAAEAKLREILTTHVPGKETIIDNFSKATQQFEKLQTIASTGLKLSNEETKGMLIRLILNVVETALIKKLENSSNEDLKILAENIVNIFQTPLITSLNTEVKKPTFQSETNILTLQNKLKNKVSTETVDAGNVSNVINTEIQEATVEISKWKQLSFPQDVDFSTLNASSQNVAISGNTAIIGAYKQNVAYIFVYDGANWNLQQTLSGSRDGKPNEKSFGFSVSIDGNYAIVGAPFETEGLYQEGVTYIFARNGTSWTQQSYMIGSHASWAGYSVAISGDIAVVGAPQEGDPNPDAINSRIGAVYTWTRSGTNWYSEEALYGPYSQQNNDFFGGSVSTDGDTLLVGAFKNALHETKSIGRAYVFVRSGTNWSEQATWLGEIGGLEGRFGYSVSISGDTAVVGAVPWSSSREGAVYIFVRNGTTWRKQAKIKSFTTSSDQRWSVRGSKEFGSSVSIDGNTAIVGDSGWNRDAAYVFVRDGEVWKRQEEFLDHGGRAVSISRNSFLIGGNETAWVFQSETDIRRGENQAATIETSKWKQLPLPENIDLPAHTGAKNISISGDTAIVGNANQNVAYIFVYDGTNWKLRQTLSGSRNGTPNKKSFGYSVAIDGNRAIVGAPFESDWSLQDGAVYTFVYNGITWTQEDYKTGTSFGSYNDYFIKHLGASVAVSGDIFIAGAPGEKPFFSPRQPLFRPDSYGAAYIWSNGKTTRLYIGRDATFFGQSVSIDATTAIVGGLGRNYRGSQAYVFVRERKDNSTNWIQQKKWEDYKRVKFDYSMVSISGDTALVSSSLNPGSIFREVGVVRIYVRNGTNWSVQAKLGMSSITTSQISDIFLHPRSVAIRGDIAIVGEPLEGSAYVFVRNGEVWNRQEKFLDHGGFVVDISENYWLMANRNSAWVYHR